MKRVVDSEGARRADLAAIHIGKAALGWDDDTYRDILWTVCRVRSAAELDFTGRRRFLAHLRSCGWSGAPKVARDVRKPLTPRQRLMWSLWQQLADAGEVTNRTMPALAAFAQRQTGVDRLEWLLPAQESLVIDGLKAWLKRLERG